MDNEFKKLASRYMTVSAIWCACDMERAERPFCRLLLFPYSVKGFSANSQHTVNYLNVDSALYPLPHDESLLLSTPPATWTFSDDENDSNEQGSSNQNNDPDFAPSVSPMSHFITQLHDLVRDLNLSKAWSELLGSHLQGWNLLDKNVTVISCQQRQVNFEKVLFPQQYRIMLQCG